MRHGNPGEIVIPRWNTLPITPERFGIPENVHIHFMFRPHSTEADVDQGGLGDQLHRSHIFLPEQIPWTRDIEEEFNQISRGNGTRYRRAIDTFDDAQSAIEDGSTDQSDLNVQSIRPVIEALYRSNIVVSGLDKGLGRRIEKNASADAMKEAPSLGLDFDQQIEEQLKFWRKFASGQFDREEGILSNIGVELQGLIRNNLRLKGADEVRVLVLVGSIHTRLYHRLRTAGVSVSRDFGNRPALYPYANELLRTLLFGLESSGTRAKRLAAYSIAESIYKAPSAEDLLMKSKGYSLRAVAGRLLASLHGDVDDVREFYDWVFNGETDAPAPTSEGGQPTFNAIVNHLERSGFSSFYEDNPFLYRIVS